MQKYNLYSIYLQQNHIDFKLQLFLDFDTIVKQHVDLIILDILFFILMFILNNLKVFFYHKTIFNFNITFQKFFNVFLIYYF